MRKLCKAAILASIGGAVYVCLELLFRGRSHWTMAVLGGVIFLIIGSFNEILPWEMPLLLQAVLGAMVVTMAELAAGILLNRWLGLGIWDYSNMPFNLWGQICLPFSVLWVFLAGIAVVLDDWLRYWLFREERPHYAIF